VYQSPRPENAIAAAREKRPQGHKNKDTRKMNREQDELDRYDALQAWLDAQIKRS
jgi:hypothetical protein